MLHTFSRVIAAGAGCVFLYAAFFLYEDERGRLQNRLEELWISIDDEAQKAKNRSRAFLQEIVRIVSGTFDKIFGPKILSVRAVVVSLCYSISSYAIACSVSTARYNWVNWIAPPITVTNLRVAVFMAIFYGLLGSFPMLAKKGQRLWLVTACISICAPFVLSVASSSPLAESPVVPEIKLLIAAGLAVASDFIFLAADRKLLRWSLSAQTLLGSLAIVLGNIILGLSFIAPQFTYPGNTVGYWMWTLWEVVTVACSANLVAVIIAFLIVMSMMILILHRLFWPLAARPVYAISHYRLVRNSKLLGMIGITCLLWAFPSSGLLHTLQKLM